LSIGLSKAPACPSCEFQPRPATIQSRSAIWSWPASAAEADRAAARWTDRSWLDLVDPIDVIDGRKQKVVMERMDAIGPSTDLRPARGVVGVLARENRLLVIRRSLTVRAPGQYCFPGGTIETGETEPVALVRELHEELALVVQPVRELWQCTTAWGTWLSWWLMEADAAHDLAPNRAEVDWAGWLTIDEILALEELLPSNRGFFEAYFSGAFGLPISD
jgi:8-oxo-dGTP diphosphatase